MIELMTRTSNEGFEGTRTAVTEKRWQSVQRRDRGADGAFVYAVRSTGIYCRPSCPSRKPRPEQVVFFALAQAAEQNGFRACRRCQPQLARIRNAGIASVAGICRQIDAQVLTDAEFDAGQHMRLTLKGLSQSVGMSPHQLERAFLRNMGITPR